MADEPEVTLENLEAATNEAEGWKKEEDSPKESASPEGEPVAEPEKEQPSDSPAGQESPVDKVAKILEGTPFKDLEELPKAWKNAVAEMTRLKQETKPYEQFLKRMDTDPQFKQYVEQARMLYENPQLAQSYQTQNQGMPTPPDIRQYDIYSQEGLAQYQQAQAQYYQAYADYVDRRTDARLSGRLAQMETESKFGTLKAQFKQKYPDINPDELQEWYMREIQNINPFEVAYKLKEFDSAETRSLEKARKELNQQIETAQKNKTPGSQSAPQQKFKAEDVVNYIERHGMTKAQEKFGKSEVDKMILQLSNDMG